MLKLVGAVLIIFASAGLGYLKSRELMLHEKNLEEFLQVILCLKGEIRCGNSSLSDALRDTACRCRGRYEEFLERVAACIEANTEEKLSIIFQNCTENYLTDLKLDEDERRKISLLGEKLGYLDREMQIRQLELYETDFLYLLQNLRKDKEEKKKNISKSWCYGWHPACNIILVIPEKGERMEVTIIFKIAAVGILVSILSQVLKHSGRDEQAFMVSLAGLLIVLFWIVPYIYELFQNIQKLFVI